MDRQRCRQIEESALAAMKDLEVQYGIKIKFKSGQIGSGFCALKFEFAEVKADGSVATKEATNYRLYASGYGLPADGMGKIFSFRGKAYKVIGLKVGCKYNILGERQPDGKVFCFQDRTAFPAAGRKLVTLGGKVLDLNQPCPDLSDAEADDNDAEREIAEAEGSQG